ncbi:MAG: ABC-F family ATP-binding cassette domain-containing protein [Alphaproteobacteria bacterium]
MAPPLLDLKNIQLTFGGTPLLTGADLAVQPGDRLCLVGRNGSGKSTLLKIAAGFVEPDDGEIFRQPGTTIAYLRQEPDLSKYETVLDFAASGLRPDEDDYEVRYLLTQLGLSGDENPNHLSGGEARRAALAQVLAPKPDILLLDEPTNHLDLPVIEWLESLLNNMRSALVLISHDRRFLENLSKSTIWLDRGRTRQLDRSFAHFEEWRDETFEQEERDAHKLDRKIAQEEHWLTYGVTARRKRNVKRLGDLHGLRAKRVEVRAEQRRGQEQVAMQVNASDKSGKLVIEATDIEKSFENNNLISPLSLKIMRGDRLGLVGANGTGKTTLIKMLTGELAPDSGTVRLGANLNAITIDQKRAELPPDTTLQDALTGGDGQMVTLGEGENTTQKHVVSYMKDFLFKPEQARTPISELSGGERGRLMLARALSRPSNLLILDEPTNDLDLETLDLLQEMLGDYHGTVLLVSHDRDFLDRTVTSVLAAEGQGQWVQYAGGYTDMLAQRRAGAAAQKAEKQEKKQKVASDKPKSQKPKTKLSYKEQYALDTLPGEMEKLAETITKLNDALADPDLYSRDAEKFARLTKELEATQNALATAEEQWLEIEMKREELDAGATS